MYCKAPVSAVEPPELQQMTHKQTSQSEQFKATLTTLTYASLCETAPERRVFAET